MRIARTRAFFPLLYLMVFVTVFAVSYTFLAQDNVGEPSPGDNPVPGGPGGGTPGLVGMTDELNEAISSGSLEILQSVLDSGADPNTVDDLGYTPLDSAITLSAVGIPTSYGQASLLLAAGADPNRKNEFGDTPMHKAAIDGDEALMTLLIANSGSPNVPNKYGKTAYQLALQLANAGAVSAIEQASEYRHPDRDKLMLWGAFTKQIKRYLATRPVAGSERDAKVREINQFLVDNGLLTAEEKAAYDTHSIEKLNNCCGQREGDGR